MKKKEKSNLFLVIEKFHLNLKEKNVLSGSIVMRFQSVLSE